MPTRAHATTMPLYQLLATLSMLLLLLLLLHGDAADAADAGDATPPTTPPRHKYRRQDLGPSPFIDEASGRCLLDACDALGRARDEVSSVSNSPLSLFVP